MNLTLISLGRLVLCAYRGTLITIVNNGHTTATGVAVEVTDRNNNSPLKGEMSVSRQSNSDISFSECVAVGEDNVPVAVGNRALVPWSHF